MDSLSLIVDTLAPLAGKPVLDIGCGPGRLSRALAARGARVTGVDPAAEAIAAARATSPDSEFHLAGAEALPVADGAFQGAVFLNSLHHVPVAGMAQALREAGRATAPAGQVIVSEPLAAGSLFAVLRCIEDETETRAAAQDALRAVVAAGAFALVRQLDYDRHDVVGDFDGFLTRMLAADRARETALRERRDRIEAAFHAQATRLPDGRFGLVQPLRAQVLAPAV